MFALVAIAAVTSAGLVIRFGPVAVWFGIAIAMIGPLIAAGLLPREDLGGVRWATSLHEIARLRRFWILVVVSISINICWHFLVNWIPTYLRSDRKLSEWASGHLTAATFLAADVGNLSGGFLSLALAAWGRSVVRARISVMSLCMILILSGTGLSVAGSDVSVIVLLCLMASGTAAFMANYFSFTQDVSPTHTGLVVGYLGGLGNLFVAGYQPLAGALRDWTGSFTANFVIVGIAPLVGMTVLILGWGKDKASEREVCAVMSWSKPLWTTSGKYGNIRSHFCLHLSGRAARIIETTSVSGRHRDGPSRRIRRDCDDASNTGWHWLRRCAVPRAVPGHGFRWFHGLRHASALAQDGRGRFDPGVGSGRSLQAQGRGV